MSFATNRTALVWILLRPFDGEPRSTDFSLQEETLREITDGELIAEAEFLSVDPYMRIYMGRLPSLPAPMIGTQVARVIESRHPDHPVGSHIYGHFGWRTHTLLTDLTNRTLHPIAPYACPDTGPNPRSYALGCLGRPGNSAYFGLLEVGRPKPGETIVVSGAAGAVGSLVGQIARIAGAGRVVGIAGSAAKCAWLTEELGYDAAVDYHGDDFAERLAAATDGGIDVYFDNVGGQISYDVMRRMNVGGRIAVCGSVCAYNATEVPLVPQMNDFHRRLLRMEGFLVNRWLGDRWFEGIDKVRGWLAEGRIRYRETVTEGFERMPEAFAEMLRGANLGKAIVKV